MVEVNRPNRQLRRLRGGKSDSVDAEGAARAAAWGQATAVPKSGDGLVECTRMLVVARRWATKARTQAASQIHSVGHAFGLGDTSATSTSGRYGLWPTVMSDSYEANCEPTALDIAAIKAIYQSR